MTQFLAQYNLTGLVLGLCSFLIIGIFHPLVIKGEYYFGTRCWWAFLLGGIITGCASLAVTDFFWQTLLAVVAFSCFWSILEVFEQRQRVLKGWFPANPKRMQDNREVSGDKNR
ncbi:MAG: DUF4491 family protein [Muribaculaceae bacterium]|nr:DUF4491 family protein [Muribaculaceae bacterium]